MNTNAIVLSTLKQQRDKLTAQLNGLNMAIEALGGGAGNSSKRGPKPGRKRKQKVDPVSGLTPIQKAQVARKANIAARKAEAVAKANSGAGAQLAAAV